MLLVHLISLFAAIFFAPSSALICYDSDQQGVVREVSNDDWKYCALIPQTDVNEGAVFGVGITEDSVESYESAFKQNDNSYKVLTVCIYEKYDLRKVSPKFQQPEFLFRCMCNYDRCNSNKTFAGYISGVQKDNL